LRAEPLRNLDKAADSAAGAAIGINSLLAAGTGEKVLVSCLNIASSSRIVCSG
jgi:hypothetical protein